MRELQYFLGGQHTIGVECKGKGRNYELTYEGTFSKSSGDWLERMQSQKHHVGDSLEEFLNGLTEKNFSLTREDQLLKKYMVLGWNIVLYISEDSIEASAVKVILETDTAYEEERRYGKRETLEELLHFMFEDYNPHDVYVLEEEEKIRKFKEDLSEKKS